MDSRVYTSESLTSIHTHFEELCQDSSVVLLLTLLRWSTSLVSSNLFPASSKARSPLATKHQLETWRGCDLWCWQSKPPFSWRPLRRFKTLTFPLLQAPSVSTTLTGIKRNTIVPTKKIEIFSTLTTDPVYLFKFKEGEGARTNFLGKFELAGIPPAPCVRGVPQVEVTFDWCQRYVERLYLGQDRWKFQPHHHH